jgi:hypothetical protein
LFASDHPAALWSVGLKLKAGEATAAAARSNLVIHQLFSQFYGSWD